MVGNTNHYFCRSHHPDAVRVTDCVQFLTPEYYSIIGFEPRDTSYTYNKSLQSSKLDDKLQDMKKYIPEGICSHIRNFPYGRVESLCWFVNRRMDPSFKIHIIGTSDNKEKHTHVSNIFKTLKKKGFLPADSRILQKKQHD